MRLDLPKHFISPVEILVIIALITILTEGKVERSKILNIVRSSNKFGDDVYRQLSKRSGNIIFSPFSTFSSLSLLALGCTGSTLLELLNNIYISSINQLTQDFDSLNNYLRNSMNSTLYNIANSVFASDDYTIVKKFKIDSKTHFGATSQIIDFSNNSAAIDIINDQISNQTMKAITNIVNKRSLSLKITVLLLNAVYFKGRWKQKFNKSKTVGNYIFHTSKGNVLCNMMISEKYSQKFYTEDNFLVLSFPFHKSHIKIVFVVNHIFGKKQIREIEKRFDSKKLFEIIPKLVSREFAVRIPKFKLNSEFSMQELLSSAGIRRIFNKGDFSKLFERSIPSHVEEVKQKASIEIDETGVTAAAATRFEIARRTRNQLLKENFILNKTFLFFLYDSRTKLILLRGRVDNPVPAY